METEDAQPSALNFVKPVPQLVLLGLDQYDSDEEEQAPIPTFQAKQGLYGGSIDSILSELLFNPWSNVGVVKKEEES